MALSSVLRWAGGRLARGDPQHEVKKEARIWYQPPARPLLKVRAATGLVKAEA